MTSFLKRLFGRDRGEASRPSSPAADRHTLQPLFRLKYAAFKDLIASNSEVLEAVASIEQKLEGDQPFGAAFVRAQAVRAVSHAFRMVKNLNDLSRGRYPELFERLDLVRGRVDEHLSHGPPVPISDLTLPLSACNVDLVDIVGGKIANLGEVANRVGLPVPAGFAITTLGYQLFLEHSDLADRIRMCQMAVDAADMSSEMAAASEIQGMILEAELPPELERAIAASYEALAGRLGHRPAVAMRSSALGEDGELSFAGQYVTVLNVPGERLLDAYRQVIAGLFTPRAMFYRHSRGIADEELAMAVGCIALVDARASGVAYSTDPTGRAREVVVVNAVYGLGAGAVEGGVSADLYLVSRQPDAAASGERPDCRPDCRPGCPPVVRVDVGSKETCVLPAPAGGVHEVEVASDERARRCLSDGELGELASAVLALEQHYGIPQEVEWARDQQGQLWILQSRRLRLARPAAGKPGDAGGVASTSAPADDVDRSPPPAEEIDGHRLLLAGGAVASPGVGAGAVCHVRLDDDLVSFPEQGVLVARRSSPRLVQAMKRASAIVTDIGAVTGHMASLAREFGVPALLDTKVATTTLVEGAVVTVDADRGLVYEGRVESLLASQPRREGRVMQGTPVYRLLKLVAAEIVPLNLTDPAAESFRAASCTTIHDIARFVHEMSFEEMFHLSDQLGERESRAVHLDERVPFDLHVIDLGGGLELPAGPAPVRKIKASAVRSAPLAAFLAGVMNEKLRWWEPRPVDLRGFASVMAEAFFTPMPLEGARDFGSRSYAIVADKYLNFSSRVGYHYSGLDCYCGQTRSKNYITFRFKGGGADLARRSRRARLITGVLARLDFAVSHKGDLVNARLKKYEESMIRERLDLLGRLVVATRQLDMRMGEDETIDWYIEAFLAGNYDFVPGKNDNGP